jgi:hypothetical protein
MAEEPLYFRQGEILTYNIVTGANTVKVLGTTMTNLPILTTGEVTSLAAGDVVGILKAGTQYWIIGRIDSSDESLNIGAGSAGRGLLGFEFATSALPSAGVTVNVHTDTTLQVTVTSEANRLLRVSLFTSVISTVAADRVPIAIRDITIKELPAGYTGSLTIPTSSSYDPSFGYVYIQERGGTVQAGPRAQVVPIIGFDDRGIAGERTYQATVSRFSGTGTCRIDSNPEGPSTLLVEDVGPLT